MSNIFGDWTVLGEADGSKNKKCVFARCKCGLEKIVQFGNLTNGSSTRCSNCARKVTAEKNRERADRSGIVNQRCAFGRYKQGAAKRKLDFSITLDEFLDIANKNCHYCGCKPSNCYDLKYCKGKLKGKSRAGKPFIHNGMDRVDSNKGYCKENCVPCCKKCNIAKNNMGEIEFYEWISRVFEHCKERIEPNGKSIPPCSILCEEVGRSTGRLSGDS